MSRLAMLPLSVNLPTHQIKIHRKIGTAIVIPRLKRNSFPRAGRSYMSADKRHNIHGHKKDNARDSRYSLDSPGAFCPEAPAFGFSFVLIYESSNSFSSSAAACS